MTVSVAFSERAAVMALLSTELEGKRWLAKATNVVEYDPGERAQAAKRAAECDQAAAALRAAGVQS